MYKLMLF